ncbi:MAG: hypothetical protein IT423_17745 [Pirellulaceae bacterium]|nr:hypothetical protein [Pirellulaceae bacterium]
MIEQKISKILELDKQLQVLKATALLEETLKAITLPNNSPMTVRALVKRNAHLFGKKNVATINRALNIRNRIAHSTDADDRTEWACKILVSAIRLAVKRTPANAVDGSETYSPQDQLDDDWVLATPSVNSQPPDASWQVQLASKSTVEPFHDSSPLTARDGFETSRLHSIGREDQARAASPGLASPGLASTSVEPDAIVVPAYNSLDHAVRLTVDHRSFVRHYLANVTLKYGDFRGACEKAHLALLADLEFHLDWENTGVYATVHSRYVSTIAGRRTTSSKQRLSRGDSIFELEQLKLRISVYPLMKSSKE